MSRVVLEPGVPLDSEQLARGVAGIDWQAWQPSVRATLNFVLQEGRILLIRKKRGLGAGKITGPGGKLEPGESALECAIREVEEELGVTTHGTREAGEFAAQFSDGLAMHVAVFAADDYVGTLRESDEALPLWTELDAIPYAQMWPDNAVWLPELIGRRHFEAHFVLDTDRLFDAELLR